MKTLAQCLYALPAGHAFGDVTDVVVERVHTDTRTLQPGDLFVALRGERFDAHEHLHQARAAGAVLALAERGLAQAGLCGVQVPDSRVALGQLATAWRAQWPGALVAVTGSNGKTTVTQMLAAVCRAHAGAAVLATQGNLNNDIGVPLTLLRLRGEHRLAVVELGMNHPGEIATLAAMAQPTVALVNNAQREHQEFMGSVAAVARENAACFAAVPPHGTVVFPSHDPHTALWRALAGTRQVLTFGGQGADVTGEADWSDGAWNLQITTPQGVFQTRLHIAGRHNVLNALAVTACALALGIGPEAIASGLSGFEPVTGRSRAQVLSWQGRTVTVVDDTYNANPDSVLAAIEVLEALPGPRLLVLGDMGEVGDQGLAFHTEVLQRALAGPIEAVWVCGAWMEQAAPAFGTERLRWFADFAALEWAVQQRLSGVASLLCKGSRFMRMERLLQSLHASSSTKGENHAAQSGAMVTKPGP